MSAPNLHNNILRLLDSASVVYSKFEHDTIASCESAAVIRSGLGIDALGSKSLLFSGKWKFFLVATHADAHIRAKGFRSITGAKDTRFATDEEIIEVLGAKSGSIPPLGFARTDFIIFVDETILSAPSYAFTPADPHESIILTGESLRKAFKNIENPLYIFREKEDGYEIEEFSRIAR